MYNRIIKFIQDLYSTTEFIPLHEPRFRGNEKAYLSDCIDSTFVSSVGEYVTKFENEIAKFTGSKYAVAAVNGTSALHIGLILADVQTNDEVITQPLTFVATANAISYCKAYPVFIDSDMDNLGMSPNSLQKFLEEETYTNDNGNCVNRKTNRVIKACIPMHVFGHPVRIQEIAEICKKYNLFLIEDSAESLGSYSKNQHTGTFGSIGVLSFNGNKIITSGSGGALITDDEKLAKLAKHLTTTGKVFHEWDYYHDTIAYNYRMSNINAALACAQLEQITSFLTKKRELAKEYASFFESIDIKFIKEPNNTSSNYWLNAIQFNNRSERDAFLEITNKNGVMTRPLWVLLNQLPMYSNCQTDDLHCAKNLQDTIVNIPSSVII